MQLPYVKKCACGKVHESVEQFTVSIHCDTPVIMFNCDCNSTLACIIKDDNVGDTQGGEPKVPVGKR
jgi:hypothetical protein